MRKWKAVFKKQKRKRWNADARLRSDPTREVEPPRMRKWKAVLKNKKRKRWNADASLRSDPTKTGTRAVTTRKVVSARCMS